MTTKQITNTLKKAQAAGNFKETYFPHITISRDEVEVFVPSQYNEGHVNDASTDEIVRHLCNVLSVVVVMKTGCGSQIVELSEAGNRARFSNELDQFGVAQN